MKSTGRRAFLQNKFSDNLFLTLEAHCCRLRIFCFTDSWKNVTKFRILVLGPWPMTLMELHFAKKETAFVFEELLWKSSLYTFPSSIFLILQIYTESIITVFNSAENHSMLVWDTVFCSLSKKSRLFYTYNNFQKNCTADYSFTASLLWFFQIIWVVSGRT